jgi:hypothetical protein
LPGKLGPRNGEPKFDELRFELAPLSVSLRWRTFLRKKSEFAGKPDSVLGLTTREGADDFHLVAGYTPHGPS